MVFTGTILDSGNRTEFESGAVRDIQEGKGRCDLLPLDIASMVVGDDPDEANVLTMLYEFQQSGDIWDLLVALQCFQIESGIDDDADLMLRVSKHFENGALKYGEDNWKKGIPVHSYIDSAVRHYLKWLRGDQDEPHDMAFVWNIMCAMWTVKNKPELNGYGEKDVEATK